MIIKAIIAVLLILTNSHCAESNHEVALKQTWDNDDPRYVELLGKDNINKKDNYKYTPLMRAIESGKYNISKELINKGANVNVKNSIFDTPLHKAIHVMFKDQTINLKLTKLLLENGAKVNAKGGLNTHRNCKHLSTPLHQAARRGSLELVKLLLEYGAKIDAKDYEKRTPLYKAVSRKSYDVVKFLLEKGAKINIKETYRGETSLHDASALGRQNVLLLLLAHGADMTIKNKKGQDALAYVKSFPFRNYKYTIEVLNKAKTPEVQELIKQGKTEKVIEILNEVIEKVRKSGVRMVA